MRKSMKRMLAVIVCGVMLLSSFGGMGTVFALEEGNARGDHPVEDPLQRGGGSEISDYQLSFYPPKAWPAENEDPPEGFDGWVMMYSVKDLDEVWSYTQDLTPEELEAYGDTGGETRMYVISNYAWADGAWNTFRAEQRDVVTGQDFGPNLYHTYVGTLENGEFVGMVQVDTIEINPSPKDVGLVYEESATAIQDFAVDFGSYQDARITHNFVFYTTEGIYEVEDALLELSFEELQGLDEGNRGRLTESLEGPISFYPDQRDLIRDQDFDEDLYYVYVAAVGEEGVFGITQSKEMIITAKTPEAPSIDEPIGEGIPTVMPMGGSVSLRDLSIRYMYDEMRSLAGGSEDYDPKIVVFNSSRDSLATVYEYFYFDDPTFGADKDHFKDMGFEPIYVPLAVDSREYVANHPYRAELVKTADAVYFMGGDQYKHVRSFFNGDGSKTEILKSVEYVLERGGVAAGTSAGMHFMSDPVFGVGSSYGAMYHNEVEPFDVNDIPETGFLNPIKDDNSLMVDGISLVPQNVLTDTHFDARGRLGRLLVGLRDSEKDIGLGGDEGTSMMIRRGEQGEREGTVIGHNGFYVVDVSDAAFPETTHFEAENVIIHFLTEGDRYNFDTGQVIPTDEKETTLPSGDALYDSEYIFGNNYETTKAIIDLVLSDDDYLEKAVQTLGRFGSEAPEFSVTLRKSTDTQSYIEDSYYYENGTGDSHLEGYQRIAVENLYMDIHYAVEEVDFEVTGIELREGSAYTQYIGFTKPVNPETVTPETIILRDNEYYYEDDPILRSGYDDQVILEFYYERMEGEEIEIRGVQSMEGEVIEPQVWIFTEGTWEFKEFLEEEESPGRSYRSRRPKNPGTPNRPTEPPRWGKPSQPGRP